MGNNHIDAPIWALIQGRVFEPTPCQPVPAPPSPMLQGMGSFAEMLGHDIPDGTAYGPMTYAEAQDVSSGLRGYVTLCIVPSDGLQAIWLNGLAGRKATDELGSYLLPGMTFFPKDGDGILLIGHGEAFSDIGIEDLIASCSPGVAFPVGRAWDKPVRNRRGENLRRDMEWTPPDMATLEDLAPLAAFLAGLNLTEKERADFRAAEILREAEDRRQIQENEAFWKAKDQADALAIPATRRLLP